MAIRLYVALVLLLLGTEEAVAYSTLKVWRAVMYPFPGSSSLLAPSAGPRVCVDDANSFDWGLSNGHACVVDADCKGVEHVTPFRGTGEPERNPIVCRTNSIEVSEDPFKPNRLRIKVDVKGQSRDDDGNSMDWKSLTGSLYIYSGDSCANLGTPYMLVAGWNPDSCEDPITGETLTGTYFSNTYLCETYSKKLWKHSQTFSHGDAGTNSGVAAQEYQTDIGRSHQEVYGKPVVMHHGIGAGAEKIACGVLEAPDGYQARDRPLGGPGGGMTGDWTTCSQSLPGCGASLPLVEVALIDAVIMGDPTHTFQKLRRGADAEARRAGKTSLLMAAFHGRTHLVPMLLDEGGADLAAVHEPSGRGVVTQAILNDHAATARLLLDRGAALEQRDHTGSTPLHHACEMGWTESTGALLARGADAGARDRWGRTPLMRAVIEHRTAVVRVLLAHGGGGDLEARSARHAQRAGFTALMYAVVHADAPTLAALVAAGASVETRDGDTNTPLIWASRLGFADIAADLLEAGARVDAKNNDGCVGLWTPDQDPKHWPEADTPDGSRADPAATRIGAQPAPDPVRGAKGRCEGATALFYAKDAATAQVLVDHGAGTQAADDSALRHEAFQGAEDKWHYNWHGEAMASTDTLFRPHSGLEKEITFKKPGPGWEADTMYVDGEEWPNVRPDATRSQTYKGEEILGVPEGEAGMCNKGMFWDAKHARCIEYSPRVAEKPIPQHIVMSTEPGVPKFVLRHDNLPDGRTAANTPGSPRQRAERDARDPRESGNAAGVLGVLDAEASEGEAALRRFLGKHEIGAAIVDAMLGEGFRSVRDLLLINERQDLNPLGVQRHTAEWTRLHRAIATLKAGRFKEFPNVR